MSIQTLNRNIGELLETAAVTHGDKPAVYFDQESFGFSFLELNQRVNQFANAFVAEGICQGDHVAVMLPNCSEFPLTWLALMKIGAVTVPLNTRYKAVDLEYVLNDSKACVLVIHDEFTGTFREAEDKTPGIRKIFRVGTGENESETLLTALADEASNIFSGPDVCLADLANIQYTSGTTGFPKGCLLTHEYWLTLGTANSDEIMIPDDIFLCVEPFYYMDPPWELVMCLSAGCRLVLARKFSPSNYMRLACEYGATVSWIIMAPWVLKQPESRYDSENKLRLVMFGAFPPRLHKAFEERFNLKAREGYGMTEIGAGCFVAAADDHMTGSGSVGKPPHHREFRIVDDDGREVPQGDIGELWIRGPGLFKGYFNKPEATREVFSGEWFHTGDLFRQDEKGYYFIVGRKKDMVRRAGDNISATEVENLLMSHPHILSAAVVAVPDPEVREELKAYIVPADGESSQTIPPEEIISYCSERIADFKLPRYIEFRTDFPKTPTGKIQKKALITEKDDLTLDSWDRLAQ